MTFGWVPRHARAADDPRVRPDPYHVLGVPPDAERSAIQAAYRDLARRHHPDFGGDPAIMAALNDAWALLSRADRRAAHDASTPRRPAPPLPGQSPVGPIAAAAERRRRSAGAHEQADREGSVLDFGRYAGWSIEHLAATDPEYLEWLVRTPIGRPHRALILEHLERRRAAAPVATMPRPRGSRFRVRR